MNQTKKIVLRAAGIESSAERAEYLAEACGADGELRRRIESILGDEEPSSEAFSGAEHEGSPKPPPTGGDNSEEASEATVDYSVIGSKSTETVTIGPYRLMEKIGEGGMGVIFVAEQTEPVRRRVALKVIKPGTDTKEVIARFNAERQALAMMDHPNIARVFDAGATPEGRPYFVMELVRGVPITNYCDRNKLSSRERLALFIDVCHAIQHAHQKGIIHRDVKPNNVLVTSHDGKPVVKVIDFGVAKAIHQRLTDHTVYTKFSQIVGTPLYMSPEQAEMSGLDIDTRSDIYSLGVLLYELLTGGTPFDRARIKKAAYDEMRRILREEDPPRPSTRISTLGKTAGSVSESRGTDPKKLSHLLRGDLDWIVMKAMEKDRARRYETANGFALDVKRFLDDEPVLASPPSTVYRMRKLIHRNRGAFTALAVTGAVLVIGVAGTTYGMVSAMTANATIRRQNGELDRSNQQLAEANRSIQDKNQALALSNEREAAARSRAERVKDFLVDAFRKADPTREGERLTVVEVLERSVEQLEFDLAEDTRTQADLLSAIGRSYSGLGLYAKSLNVFQRERDLRAKLDPPDERLRMRADRNYAYALYHDGQYQAAIDLIEKVLSRQRDVLGADDPDTLNTLGSLANCFIAVNRTKEAMPLYKAVLTKRTETQGEDHEDTLVAVAALASAHQRLGQFDEALGLSKRNLEKHKTLLGDDHPQTLGALERLGSIYNAMGEFDTAIPLYRQAWEMREAKLGPKHPLTLSSKSGLGFVFRDAGKLDEALKILDEVLKVKQEELGLEDHSTLSAANKVARVYLELGRYKDALPLVKVCFEKHRKMSGPKSEETVASMNTLGMTYFYAGQPREALPVFIELLEIQKEVLGEENPTTISIMNNLAMAHQYVGDLDEALPLMDQAFKWRRENLGKDHPKTLVSQQNLASILKGVGRLEESIKISEDTVKLHQLKLGLPHRQTVSAMSALANAYVQRGDYLKGLVLARETLAASKEAVGDEHPDTLRSMNSIGIAALGCGYVNEANEMFAKSLELRREKLGEKHSFTIQSIANLATGMIQAKNRDEALRLAKEANAAAEQNLKPDAPVSMNVKFTLARAQLLAEDRESAIGLLTELVTQRKKSVGDAHPNTWKAQHYLAKAYFDNDQIEEAVTLLAVAVAGRAEKLGESNDSTIGSRLLLAKCLVKQDKHAEAEPLLQSVWSNLPPIGDGPLIPTKRKLRISSAAQFVDLYEAWAKPEMAAEWMKRTEEEEQRPEALEKERQ